MLRPILKYGASVLQTAAAPGNDMTTWDLPRILREIDLQFAASLKSADQLQQIKITEYADRLSEDLTGLDWPADTHKKQFDWIGKSIGANVVLSAA